MMMGFASLALLTLILIAACHPCRAAQVRGGRDEEPAKPEATPKPNAAPASRDRDRGRGRANAPPRNTTRGEAPKPPPKPRPPAPAELTVVAVPADSTFVVNGTAHKRPDGVLHLTNLAAGEYRVLVSRPGYREEAYTIDLAAGEKKRPPTIELEPAHGTLNVTRGAQGATVSVAEDASGKLIGRYDGGVSGLELEPGSYRLAFSKEGHRTAERLAVIKPGETLQLESPALEALRPAARRPPGPSFRPDVSMSFSAAIDGKDFLFTLTGRSGETRPAGMIEVVVSVSGGRVVTHSVTGMLPGYQCHADVVKIENVDKSSFQEPPLSSNDWRRAVVRVRPKDSKRPMRFQIIWKLSQQGAPAGQP